MIDNIGPKRSVGSIFDILLPLFLVALLIALCVQLLLPFVGLLVWTIILAICFKPLHERLVVKRKMSPRRSAVIIGLALSALVLVPTAIAASSAARSVPELIATIQSGERPVPPAPARLKELPVVGERAHETWTQASTDLPAFTKKYGTQIAAFTKTLLGMAAGLFTAVLALVLAIIFA